MSADPRRAASPSGTGVTDPAYTIRRALTRNLVEQRRVDAMTLAQVPGSVERVPAHEFDREAIAALDVLLAVGERDKAEIARLADRAVCSGCGQDVDEGGACHTPECHTGEMIPSSDLPGALLHLCEENAEEREEWRSDWEALRAEAKALEVAGERDRQQIARLTEALERIERSRFTVAGSGLTPQEIARAVLAGEEDADNG